MVSVSAGNRKNDAVLADGECIWTAFSFGLCGRRRQALAICRQEAKPGTLFAC
jgi:hypothetical protein